MITAAVICLALNVFYEARGATPFDQEAVTAVALNRADAEHQSVCHVIKEPRQFSWTADHRFAVPKPKNIVDKRAWSDALVVAQEVMYSKAIRQRFGNIMYYHTHYVKPLWDRHLKLAFSTPYHSYYRRA
jgi:N-acetylmuramoyl-L-alanine amidase